MNSSLESSKSNVYEKEHQVFTKMEDSNIRDEDNSFLKKQNDEKDHSSITESQDKKYKEREPTNCYRFGAIVFTVGIVAVVIYLLQDILSEKENRCKNKFTEKGNLQSNIDNRFNYGSRGGGYAAGLGGHYFARGFGAVYYANNRVGTRLRGSNSLSGRGGGGWGGFGGKGGFGCFDENSLVWTKNVTQSDAFAKQIYVKNLHEGSLIATFEPSIIPKEKYKFMWTRATDVTVSKGIWTAYTFTFTNFRNLTVTSPHLMIVKKNDQSYFIRGDMVQIGDIMFVDEKELSVRFIRNHRITTKVSVETEDGTISVNNVFVSGLCEYNPNVVKRTVKYHFIIDRYIQNHFGKEYLNMCMDDSSWKKRYVINNGYQIKMK